ncbi:NAD(P)-binding protein [Delitschia confertaspora ATCC 74209]|uniref:NAD(P)-binding protein n=1 Tax=Delitschia confertaspora ATCC 74209 TaxID=1513339 RepID=A0A9P4JUG6_9PLEO|nr:NAD(P)-binding protein [Delitschia confertaspora ATCC 74209]
MAANNNDNYSDERANLINRQIPQMQLSTASNPFTAPRLPGNHVRPDKRAEYRFAVRGNAIITGGAGTLALEAARALLEHGLSGLCLWDINLVKEDSAFGKVLSLESDFPKSKVTFQTVDVRDPASVHTAMEATVKELGGVDILCCFAGVVGCVPAVAMSYDEWKRVHDVNQTGSFLCAQAFAKQIIKQNDILQMMDTDLYQTYNGGGSIIFTASLSAHTTNFPQPQAAYNSSKASLISLAKSLAAEWTVHGIRVNTLSPGYMNTILNDGPGLENARSIWNSRNPMGRMGEPWELTGPLVMLCSNAGRYVNGADILVDGGACVF